MFYLIYTSIAKSGLGDEDLKAILSQARDNNSRHGITGLLLYKHRCFMQLIEGEEAPVRSLMEKIKTDSRHSDILILQAGHQNSRQFPNWAMAFRTPENQSSISLSEPAELAFTDEVLRNHSSNATQLLHLFEKHV